MITQEDKSFLVSLRQSDIDRNFIERNFVYHYNPETKKVEKPRFIWSDEFSLKKGECNNKEDIQRTNVGLFIFNKFIVENLLEPVMTYWNEPINKKTLGKFEANISEGIKNDLLTLDDYAEYQNRLQWVLSIHTMVSGSFTEKTIVPLKSIITKRNKLLKDNAEKLAEGDAVEAVKIEKELLADAKKELANEPGMDMFNSGARGNFDNNYKCNSIIRGPVFDPISGKYKMAPNSFSEGLQKENIPEFASAVTMGQYPKSVGTAVGGYAVKRFYAEYQNIVIGPKGSDCHSLMTLEIQLDNNNYKDYIDRYIVEGKRLVKLNASNIKSYIGKTVHLRSPMFCTSEKLCNVCFGDLPYRLGVKNVGLTAAKIGSNFVNLGMKSFHDSSMKLNEVNPDKMLV